MSYPANSMECAPKSSSPLSESSEGSLVGFLLLTASLGSSRSALINRQWKPFGQVSNASYRTSSRSNTAWSNIRGGPVSTGRPWGGGRNTILRPSYNRIEKSTSKRNTTPVCRSKCRRWLRVPLLRYSRENRRGEETENSLGTEHSAKSNQFT